MVIPSIFLDPFEEWHVIRILIMHTGENYHNDTGWGIIEEWVGVLETVNSEI